MRYIQGKKGQAMIETALVLPLVLMLFFGIIVMGIYIYDMTVFVYASNKALDHGVGMLTETCLTDEQKEEIEEKALDAAGTALFIQGVEAYAVTNSTAEEITLTVKVKADFVGNLPFTERIAEVKAESSYVYKKYS